MLPKEHALAKSFGAELWTHFADLSSVRPSGLQRFAT